MGLQLLGIPVFADGFIIQIPEGTFEVAEACAGLRFLIASIVFGCFFATVVYRSKWRRSIFIALSIDCADRGKRVPRSRSCRARPYCRNAAAAMTDHVLYGWLFFTIVTLVLIAIGICFREDPIRPGACDADCRGMRAGAAVAHRVCRRDRSAARARRPGLSPGPRTCLGSFIAGAGDLARPARNGGWVPEPVAPGDWRPTVAGADRVSTVAYRKGAATVTEFVALFRLPKRGSPLTRAGADVGSAGTSGGGRYGPQHRLVWRQQRRREHGENRAGRDSSATYGGSMS